MKKLIFLVGLFISFVSFGQVNDTTKYYKSADYGWQYKRLKADSILMLPNGTVINRAWQFPKTDTTYLSNRINQKLNISDTATMLLGYYRATNPNGYITSSAITGKMNYTDTASMLSPYARTSNLPSLTPYVKYTDTSSMLNGYYRSSNPSGYITSAAISNKVNYSDTASMLSGYKTFYPRAAISVTNTGSSGAATYNNGTGVLNVPNYTLAGLGGISLTSLGVSTPLVYNSTTGYFSIWQANSGQGGYITSADWNKFNNKIGATDTASMLSGYYRNSNPSGYITSASISGKVNYTDTASMLSAYYNKTAADALLATKQAQLSGTGFVKASGTTISYDNSTYLTTSSAASTYVPYTGATTDLNIGAHNFEISGTSPYARVQGDASSGFISESAGVKTTYRPASIIVNDKQGSLYAKTLYMRTGILAANYDIVMPDKSGTVAMTSDIPSLSGYLTSATAASTYLPLSGGNLSGTLNTNSQIFTTYKTDYQGIVINGGSAYNTNAVTFFNNTYPTDDTKYFAQFVGNWASSGTWGIGTRGTADNTIYLGQASSGVINTSAAVDLQIGAYKALHAGNYSSYALSLSGGTLTGGLNGTAAVFSGNVSANNFYASNRLYAQNSSATLEIGLLGTDTYVQSYLSGTAGNNNMLFYTGTSERMRITNSGNVDIGATASNINGAKLFVAGGTTSFFDASSVRGISILPSYASSYHAIYSDYVGGSFYPISISARQNSNDFYISTSGSIGIGTTSPSYTLDISGSFRATTGITSGGQIAAGGTNNSFSTGNGAYYSGWYASSNGSTYYKQFTGNWPSYGNWGMWVSGAADGIVTFGYSDGTNPVTAYNATWKVNGNVNATNVFQNGSGPTIKFVNTFSGSVCTSCGSTVLQIEVNGTTKYIQVYNSVN